MYRVGFGHGLALACLVCLGCGSGQRPAGEETSPPARAAVDVPAKEGAPPPQKAPPASMTPRPGPREKQGPKAPDDGAEARAPLKAPQTVEDVEKKGLTLAQSLRLREALWGKQCGALINDELATRRDRRLPRVVALEPKELVRHVRLHLLTGQHDLDLASDDELRQAGHDPAKRDMLMKSSLQAVVFDGASAHTVNLLQFDRRLGGYVYWEPWAKGTFLGQGNNKAGIAARQHPSSHRYFWVTPEELEKVLYSVLAEWEVLERDRKLIGLLNGPEGQALAELKKLHAADPKNPQTGELRLLGAGQFYLSDNHPRAAGTAFQVCRALYPASIEAVIGLADARRLQGGHGEEAVKLYREALDGLARDTRFTPLKKARLEQHIRKHLPAPRAGSPEPGTGEKRARQTGGP